MQFPLPILIMIGAFFVILGILYSLRLYKKQKKLRSPVTQNLLRSPGQSLLSKLDDINEDLMAYLFFAFFVPLAIYSLHISISYFTGSEENYPRLAVSVCVGLGFFIFSVFKVTKLLNDRRTIRLDYEGGLAVGQELDQLMHAGFYVYHDFPADNFNIDHIVVGSKGVFAVETKVRSKSTSKNRMEDATVEYDGRMLYFPKSNDHEATEQVERHASWLSSWLGKSIGEPLAARAIVALPGWYVKRTSSEGIPVVNPKQFSSLFEHIQPRPLSESMITRINHQIDQKYRVT